MSSPPAPEPHEQTSEPLVLVSDTSTEAERLIACLRARGFRVRDVPLLLLAGRVESQKARLIVCDGEAPKLLDAITKIRSGEWGKKVEILILGGTTSELMASLATVVDDLPDRQFARPIDVYSILQTVEERIGSPVNRSPLSGNVSMASLPRLNHPPSVPHDSNPPPRFSSPVPSARSSGSASLRLSPMRLAAADVAMPSIVPRSSTHPAPIEEPSALQATPQFPVTRVSRELEFLLESAEQKLNSSSTAPQAAAPASEHLSPEAELNAILPPDVLAALDEPLDVDDSEEPSSPGTAPGERARFRSNVPTASLLDRDTGTGRVPSRPGNTAANVSVNIAAPPIASKALPTPVPASQGSFVPMPSLGPTATVQLSFGETLAPAATQPFIPRDSLAESDTDAPAATLPPQRHRTEAEISDDEITPRPSMSPDDLISTAPPHAAPPKGPQGAEQEEPPRRPPEFVPSVPKSPRVYSPVETADKSPPDRRATVPPSEPVYAIPAAVARGDALRALAELIRKRYSGSLAFEDEHGVRRVVLRDGDFVVVASGIEGESLVAFLIQRGDLPTEASKLERKLPFFGRHAGAALIAHGHLRQDELWPVLRAHAEWLLGRALSMESGAANLEAELPARLQSEPAVFGGATGAEVLIETARRVITPEQAIEALGGTKSRLTAGPQRSLLNECALEANESTIVEQSSGKSLEEVLELAGNTDFAAAVEAMVALGVLELLPPAPREKIDRTPPPRDAFDDAAIRSRVALRRALVDEGDYFAFLGVDREATGYQIRHAFLDLRREFEPSRLLTAATADLREDVDVIVEVLDEAYDVLRDPTRRERYRRALAADPH